MDLPYLTDDFAGIGGTIKDRPEDFAVTEIPLYEPSGQGEHVYVGIEKIGIPTFEAVDRIARALNVSPKGIGYAGMKDAQAVTRQTLSIFGTTPEKVQAMQVEGVTVQWADKHLNKIRMGHLKGNRFAIKVRNVQPTDVVRIEPVVKRLAERGMPNYFGEQRFGRRGDNHLLGAALIRSDPKGLMDQLLGRPLPTDDAQTQGARKAYDQNDLRRAMRLWPRNAGMERRVLARLIKAGKPGQAMRAIEERVMRLWVSAVQSHMFNQVIAERVRRGILDKVLTGDFAYKHENGAGFPVEDAEKEQPRVDAFEISPTGPLVGYRMTLPQGEPLKMEEAVLAQAQLTPADFRKEGGARVKGTRRPARVKPEEVELAGGVDEHGPFVSLAFTLPAGSFATVFLREIMKDPKPTEAADGADEGEESEADGDTGGEPAADAE